MIKSPHLLLITFLFLLVLPLFPSFVVGLVTNSTLAWFNVSNLTYFNWTSGNITIGSFNNSIQIYIDNKTTFVSPNYSQHVGISGDYDATNEWGVCFPEYQNQNYNLSFVVRNQSGTYINITNTLNDGSTEEFILSIHPFCPPGKYYGYFKLYRAGNSSDNATVYAYVDIPLSVNNTFNTTANDAYFKGNRALNDSYHSYYFNTSELSENITYLTLVLTNLDDDVDLFLFDNSGNLQGKSIEKSTNKESIMDISLPTSPAMWEIRVYGNVSSGYRGYLYYSTLNITNTNSPGATVGSLDFGDLDPNTTYPTTLKNYTLKNEDDRILLNVNEYPEIYHVDTWTFKNTSQDFVNFLVPNFTQKIKVKIEWIDENGKNITDWNLYLTDPSGTLIDNSTDKFVNSNKTNATREEFIVYNGPFTTKEGSWNISVRNVTNSTYPMSYYNVTAYILVNASSWISTNYEANFDFNSSLNRTLDRSDRINNTYNVSLNLTIPEREVLDGKYEGYLKYNNTEGWVTRLPISFNISAGTLTINESLKNSTIRLTDNIGFNKTLTLNVTFNNTGSYPIYYTNSTSNYTLTLGSNNISFTVDDWPTNPINASRSGTINITFNINTAYTGNSIGIYRGWIFFNTTNMTLNSSSYPYKTFNLTLEVNLTNLLDVRILDFYTSDSNKVIENISSQENITLITAVYLMNGTQLGDDNDNVVKTLYVENYTSAWITEYGVTPLNSTVNYTLTNRTQYQNPDTPSWLCDGIPLRCRVNFTVPFNRIGGSYNVSTRVNWNTDSVTLTGFGVSNDSIKVNRTGLYLTALTSMYPDLQEGGNISYLNVSVINYGFLKATGSISFSNTSSCGSTITQFANENCTSFSTMNLDGNGTTTCLFSWKIVTVDDVSGSYDECDFTISTSDAAFNSIPGTITVWNVSVSSSTSTSTSTSTSSTSNASTTSKVSGGTDYLNIIDYPSSISIEQGGSKKVEITVNNTNKTLTQNMVVSVDGINSSWFSVNPSTAVKLKKGESYTFEVTFNIPNNASIGNYSAKFNATSVYINPVRPTVSFIYDTVLKSFTLKVTPGEALKSEINTKLSQYKNEMNSLEEQINQSKAKNYNTSEAEDLFNQLQTKINQANTYVSNGDYNSAYNLLDGIASLINQTESALSGLSSITGKASGVKGDWWSWGKWVVIVVVVIVSSVLGYMLWPAKPGETKPAPVTVIQGAVGEKKDKITETFAKLKERWKMIREKRKES